jgi:hypothetical protein
VCNLVYTKIMVDALQTDMAHRTVQEVESLVG